MKKLQEHIDIGYEFLHFNKEDSHIPTQIFKAVAIDQYLKLSKNNSETIESFPNEMATLISKEAFRHINTEFKDNGETCVRDTDNPVDIETFKNDYIHFCNTLKACDITSKNLKTLRAQLLTQKDKYGKKNDAILLLDIKNFYTYTIRSQITQKEEPFLIVLFALKKLDIYQNKTLIRYQSALKTQRVHLTPDIVKALEWCINACIEDDYANESLNLWNGNKITISGLISFLNIFNYSNYVVKNELLSFLNSLFEKKLKKICFCTSDDLLISMRLSSPVQESCLLFEKNQHKWPISIKWGSLDRKGMMQMSDDNRFFKKCMAQYFDITDKKTDFVYDLLKVNEDPFVFPYFDNTTDTEIKNIHENINCNILIAILLLALNGPTNNYISFVCFFELYYETFCLSEKYADADDYRNHITEQIYKQKSLLKISPVLGKLIIEKFRYIYEHTQELFSPQFITEHNLWQDKSFEDVLMDIYTHI